MLEFLKKWAVSNHWIESVDAVENQTSSTLRAITHCIRPRANALLLSHCVYAGMRRSICRGGSKGGRDGRKKEIDPSNPQNSDRLRADFGPSNPQYRGQPYIGASGVLLLLFESSGWSFPFPHASVSLHFIMVEQVTTGRVLWRCK